MTKSQPQKIAKPTRARKKKTSTRTISPSSSESQPSTTIPLSVVDENTNAESSNLLTEAVFQATLGAKISMIKNVTGYFPKTKKRLNNPPPLKKQVEALTLQNQELLKRIEALEQSSHNAPNLTNSPSISSSTSTNIHNRPSTSVLTTTESDLTNEPLLPLIAYKPSKRFGRFQQKSSKTGRSLVTLNKKIAASYVLNKAGKTSKGIVSKLARETKSSISTVTHWKKLYDPSSIPQLLAPETFEKRTRLRYGKYPILELILAEWIRRVRASRAKISLSLPVIQAKAKGIFHLLKNHPDTSLSSKHSNSDEFKASPRWFYGFLERHGINKKNLHGEAGSIPLEEINRVRAKYQLFLRQFPLEDIFNADEFGLFYRSGPSVTYSPGSNAESGLKESKERITVLAACSALGEKKCLL